MNSMNSIIGKKMKYKLFLVSPHQLEPSFHLVYVYEELGSKHSLHFF